MKSKNDGSEMDEEQIEPAGIEPKTLQVQELIEILEKGSFDKIVGTIENETLDFKKEPYHLKNKKNKLELAKDISAFGNSGGGVILMGVSTRKEEGHPHEIAEQVRPFDKTLINQKQYEDIINAYIYPAVDVKIKWIPSPENSNKGLAYIRIPERESQRKPFLITKVLADDGREQGNVVGFFQRKRDNIAPLSAKAMHHALKDGLRFDKYLSEIKTGIENLSVQKQRDRISRTTHQPITSIHTPLSSDITDEELDQRIDDAIETVGLAEDIAYVLVAHPKIKIEINGLFESRNTETVKLIDSPSQLRHAGFDISTQERSKIVDGKLRRTVLRPYKLLEVWRDGVIAFVTEGGEGLLCWGNYNKGQPLLVNTLALVESTYLFHDFVKTVYQLSNVRNCRLTTKLLLHNLPTPQHYALPKFRNHSFRRYTDVFWAKNSEIKAQANFYWKQTTAEKAAYDLVAKTYAKFGAEHDLVPYTAEIKGQKVIDVEKIKSIG